MTLTDTHFLSRGVLAVALLAVAVPIGAQVEDPTNPAQRVVYSADATAAQKTASQQVCYDWSTAETGWNPVTSFDQLKADHSDAVAAMSAGQGAGVRGAARGALAGLAIGAIAGDAGAGAAIGAVAGGVGGRGRARRGQQAAQAEFEAAVNEFANEFRYWDRHWSACMEGNGYVVK
jgi:hypothetical protein